VAVNEASERAEKMRDEHEKCGNERTGITRLWRSIILWCGLRRSTFSKPQWELPLIIHDMRGTRSYASFAGTDYDVRYSFRSR